MKPCVHFANLVTLEGMLKKFPFFFPFFLMETHPIAAHMLGKKDIVFFDKKSRAMKKGTKHYEITAIHPVLGR